MKSLIMDIRSSRYKFSSEINQIPFPKEIAMTFLVIKMHNLLNSLPNKYMYLNNVLPWYGHTWRASLRGTGWLDRCACLENSPVGCWNANNDPWREKKKLRMWEWKRKRKKPFSLFLTDCIQCWLRHWCIYSCAFVSKCVGEKENVCVWIVSTY